jgi:hypothetical protein
VGRAIRISALTLGAGFAVLALSGLFPNSLPLVADFGLAVVLDLALAVGAVFLVMLPLAVALERKSPLQIEPLAAAPSGAGAVAGEVASAPTPAVATPATPPTTVSPPVALPAQEDIPAVSLEPAPPAQPSTPETTPRRVPGVSGRRRPPRVEEEADAEPPAPEAPRRPGVSGRRRGGKRPPGKR